MIRTSSHRLNIETGRHRGLDRNERTCRHCLKSGNLVVEDEDHILHKCPLTEPDRSKLISKIESLSCNFDLTRLNVARFNYEVNQPDEGSRPSLSDESKEIVQLSTRYINNAYNTMLKSKPGWSPTFLYLLFSFLSSASLCLVSLPSATPTPSSQPLPSPPQQHVATKQGYLSTWTFSYSRAWFHPLEPFFLFFSAWPFLTSVIGLLRASSSLGV